MKSVTIKDLKGDILIKVYKAKHGYEAIVMESLADIDVIVRDDNNKQTKIKFRHTEI